MSQPTISWPQVGNVSGNFIFKGAISNNTSPIVYTPESVTNSNGTVTSGDLPFIDQFEITVPSFSPSLKTNGGTIGYYNSSNLSISVPVSLQNDIQFNGLFVPNITIYDANNNNQMYTLRDKNIWNIYSGSLNIVVSDSSNKQLFNVIELLPPCEVGELALRFIILDLCCVAEPV